MFTVNVMSGEPSVKCEENKPKMIGMNALKTFEEIFLQNNPSYKFTPLITCTKVKKVLYSSTPLIVSRLGVQNLSDKEIVEMKMIQRDLLKENLRGSLKK